MPGDVYSRMDLETGGLDMSVGVTPTREEIAAKIQAAMGSAYTSIATLEGKLDGIIQSYEYHTTQNRQIREDIRWYQTITVGAIVLATLILTCLILIEGKR